MLPLSLLALGLSLSAAVSTLAQTTPAFEVASVRLNTGSDDRASWSGIPGPGPVRIVNASLRTIIGLAYGISPLFERFSIAGGPENILSRRFDMNAKLPDGASPDQTLFMLRALLAERFRLRIHMLSFSTRADSFDSPAPSIFTALREQLGLRLETGTGPWEVLVVDSVDMPTPN